MDEVPPPLVRRAETGLGRSPKLAMEAWEAAWAFLQDGPKSRPYVIKAMREFSGLSANTCMGLLRLAVNEGYLHVKERDESGRPTLARPE